MPSLSPSAWLARLAAGTLALAACARAEVPAPPARPHASPPVAAPPAPVRRPLPAEWVYWEPTELDLHAAGRAPPLPLTEDQVARPEGAAARWAQASEATRSAILKRGFAVVPASAQGGARLGAFYRRLADERVPFVITVDTLTWLAHAAFSRALAEAEDRELAPALGTMLGRLDLRLAAEERGARSDLVPAYAIAHGVVAVARALSDAAYAVPPELAPRVEAERERVVAHAGQAESVLLGTTVDYAALAPRAALEERDARAGLYRAVAWLAQAPFLLLARTEAADARIGTAQARTHARAALLLARLFDVEIDKEVARAWATIARVGEFVGGAPDDLSPVKLAQIASTVGLDVRDAAAIENVVLVDKLRRAAARGDATRLYDGAGGLTPAVRALDGGAPGRDDRWPFPRAAVGMRILGARASPDGEILQGLVFPAVGAAVATARSSDAGAGAPARGRRALPSALDVAAWLGSSEAREALRETGADAFEGYDAALEHLVARRPREGAPERHASLYVSGLDVVASYLAASSADAGQVYGASGAWRKRKVETALGLWTVLRHDSIAFARRSLGADVPGAVTTTEARGYVEPHPEAIGKLLALVRQTARGLARLASVPADAPAQIILTEIERILTGCLRVSLREANDEPLGGDDLALLASLPGRLQALDARLARSGEADVALVVDVHTDAEGARVLEEATGLVDDLYLVVREPRSSRLALAVGAALAHYEFAQPVALRLTDGAWRARLRAGSPPPRHAFASAYVIEEPRGNQANAP